MGRTERNYNQYRPSGGGTYLRGRRRSDLSEALSDQMGS